MLEKGEKTYFVGVSEPGRSLLLTTHQCNPLVTTTAQTLPHVWIPIHATCLLGLLEWTTSSCADAMGETFVVPESAVLQYQPTSRLANTTPPFSLVPVTTNPSWRVEVSVEAEFLLVRCEIGV